MTDREKFEAWAVSDESWCAGIERHGNSYKAVVTAASWVAWQAGSRSAATPAPAQPERFASVWNAIEDDPQQRKQMKAQSGKKIMAKAAQPEGQPGEPVAWKDMTPWMREFLGNGEGYVRTLYNEPHDAISRTDVGSWIQAASDMLRRLHPPKAGAAAPSEGAASLREFIEDIARDPDEHPELRQKAREALAAAPKEKP